MLTFWGTTLHINAENKIIHGNIMDNHVKLTPLGQLIYRTKQGREIILDGENSGLVSAAQEFKIIKNIDESISVKIGDRFLSARPGGEISLVKQDRDWEHFYAIK